ncbi:MAG: CHAT domain-containing protein [Acidobacteriia bacterium]|nr:CHAT domain-containing protein [Terriglobia bacterium]
MKTGRILACCLLLIALGGSARQRGANRVPHPAGVAALSASLRQGGAFFGQGRYREAAAVFQAVQQTAHSLHIPSLEARALGNLGACQFAQQQYQSALRLFLEAHRRLEAAGDPSGAALFDANIASVYIQMGAYGPAAEWVEQSLSRLSRPDRAAHLPQLQIQLATLRARQGRQAESSALFRQGIENADRAGDLELYALGWNRWGEQFLEQGNLPQAERALLQAFYVRKVHHLALDSSYGNLGQLRLEQGDLLSASVLLDRAVDLAGRPGGRVPAWEIYDARGRVRLAQGRLREALEDLRIALRLARVWRRAAPADDTTRIGVEGKLDRLYSALVEAGNRLYGRTREPALLRETFAAEEENRAASLRALLNHPHGQDSSQPAAYGEAVTRLQLAEGAALRHQDTGGVTAARADLVRLEASRGPGLPSVPPDLADAIRRKLDARTVLLSFHLGRSISWLWALDRAGVVLYRLPPRDLIESQVRATLAALREDRPTAAGRSADLYATLFAPLAARFQRASRWLLALDETLFDLPIAALPTGRGPRSVYVAELHTVEVIPGAAYWLDSAARDRVPLAPLLVGVADPIYNRADARLERTRPGSAPQLALPRLAGSSTEIEACARAWAGPSVLLRGSAASLENVAAQLRRRPAIVHLATHYLESAAHPGYALIALTLAPGGEPQLLTPFELSRWRIQAGLVVLSGCHSAAGPVLPATGLQGLTRAWLAAGAQSVIASLWETPDDDGALFRALYRNLRDGPALDPARALHDAQLDMIHDGGRHARPTYWGAYFLVGNPGKTVLETWD